MNMNMNYYNNIQTERNNLINENNKYLKELKKWKICKVCMEILAVVCLLSALIFTSLGTDSTDLFCNFGIGITATIFFDKQVKTLTNNIENNNQKLNYLNSTYHM